MAMTTNLLMSNAVNPTPMIPQIPLQTPILLPQADAAPPPPTVQSQQSSLENSPLNKNRYSNIIELPVTPSPPPCPTEQQQQNLPAAEPTTTEPPAPPAVPLSHLLAGNQYPSLHNVPVGIAQSFAPMFVQPTSAPTDGADIYNDYVNDPYNLTLQIDQTANPAAALGQQPQQIQESQQQPQNVFQSANYFGSYQFGSGRIPPGSEMLFGEP